MSKILRRTAAGFLAGLIALTSAASDAFLSPSPVHTSADSVGGETDTGYFRAKNFKNFECNNEIDTKTETHDGETVTYYNTSLGLHTDKTAAVSEISNDGRTFDLDLKSWYIGENPADVGMILDASGSMAWTSDNLNVMNFQEEAKSSSISPGEFLIPDQVNKLLPFVKDGDLTIDNSKLSYADYNYYIYDARDTVSEFVPIGYWNGELAKGDTGLRGYYNFNGDSSIRWNNNIDETGNSKMVSFTTTNAATSSNANFPISESGKNAIEIGKSISNTDYKGMLLDVSPTILGDDNKYFEFTISFALRKSNKETNAKSNEIFRIGTDDNYWNIKVPDSQANGLTVRSNSGGGPTNGKANVFDEKYSFYSVVFYKDANDKLNYCLYKDDKLVRDVYDENKGDPKKNLGDFSNLITVDPSTREEKVNIIFDPCGVEGTGTIYVDDIYFFDKALSASEVETFAEQAKIQDVKSVVELKNCAADDDGNVIAQVKENFDKAGAGWYYINSHSTWEDIANPNMATGKQLVGLIKETDSKGKPAPDAAQANVKAVKIPSIYQDNEKFVNCAVSGDTSNPDYAFNENTSIKFFLDENYDLRCYFNNGTAQSKAKKEGNQHTQCSYVYYKPQSTKIKSELLEDAITAFTDGLKTNSSSSKISAVRFSTDKAIANSDHKSLLSLNWNTVGDLSDTKIFEGNNTTKNSRDTKNGNEYYYTLTGGTFTWTGMYAYNDLLNTDDIKNDTNDKYLILFTDGRDSVATDGINVTDKVGKYSPDNPTDERTTKEAYSELAGEWAKEFKKEGYTIFCVLLASGSVRSGDGEGTHDAAVTFLRGLASDKPTDEVKEGEERKYFYEAANGESLNDAFMSILEAIRSDLKNYTVKDYIDPRFDLVDYSDADNPQVWHLGTAADGTMPEIKVESLENAEKRTDGEAVSADALTVLEYDSSKGYYEYTPRETNNGKGGKTARLYYDSEKHMYYLEWAEQIIPGHTKPVNSDADPTETTDTDAPEALDIWQSIITVRAKNDFIGGNSILTNGNEANMNYVYNPDDVLYINGTEKKTPTEYQVLEEADKAGYEAVLQASSGTERARDVYQPNDKVLDKYGEPVSPEEKVVEGGEEVGTKRYEYPSKGFPRTTVNVRLLKLKTTPLDGVSYLGEGLAPTQLLKDLEDNVTPSYYLEYLLRYAKNVYKGDSTEDKTLKDLLNEWLGFTVNKAGEVTSPSGEYNKINSFAIPYIYLPDPADTADETWYMPSVNTKNNAGTEYSQNDVVGILEYSWERIKSPGYVTNNTQELVIKTTEKLTYSLTVKFIPFKDEDIAELYNKNNFYFVDDDFVDKTKTAEGTGGVTGIEERYNELKRSNRYEYLTDGNFITDENYRYGLKADVIKDEKAKYAENYADYSSDPYKKAAGEVQLEVGEEYGTNGTEKILPGETNSLKAESRYAKDIISGGLALELRVKGEDMEGFWDKYGTDGIELTAKRCFDDTIEYNGADVTDEKYTLKFELIGEGPKDPVGSRYYSVFAKLKNYEVDTGSKFYEGLTKNGEEPAAYDLPIGTYVIEYDNDKPVKGGSDAPMFSKISADTSPAAFKANYFVDNVINGINDTREGLSGDEITNENIMDYAAPSAAKEETGKSTVTFYLGTKQGDTAGTKGEVGDTDSYLNDRLGVILLTYGNESLSISKTVENATEPEDINKVWEFHVSFTYTPEAPNANKPSRDDINSSFMLFTLYDSIHPDGYRLTRSKEENGASFDAISVQSVNDPTNYNNYIQYTINATIKLKHGQRVTIDKVIPPDIADKIKEATYRVEENVVGDHEFTVKNGSIELPVDIETFEPKPPRPPEPTVYRYYLEGEVQPGESADFINSFPSTTVELPSAGGVGRYRIIAIGSAVMMLGAVLLLTDRRKKRAGENS